MTRRNPTDLFDFPDLALDRAPPQRLSNSEVADIWFPHRALAAAFRMVQPTEALMENCYGALRRHGLEPIQ